MKAKLGLLCLALSAFSFPAVSSESFGGSWNITGYEEPNLSSSYTWCFNFTVTGGVLGYSNSGTWNVPSYSAGWSGEWYRNGDEIILHGVADGTYLFSWKGRVLGESKIGGRQVEFFINGGTDTAGTFYGTRLTAACPAAASSATTSRDPAK